MVNVYLDGMLYFSRHSWAKTSCCSTIIIDPAHDQAKQLTQYARTWKADSKTWHFLTGPLADIQKICRGFEMAFFPDEALLVHSFHTVVIDREGKMAGI